MKKSSVPANKTDRLVQFKMQDAQRIASVVHIVESERRGRNPSRLPRAFAGRGTLRLGTISATWEKGTTATVTQINGDGSAITPEVTFQAKNWFARVVVDCPTKKVACASVDGAWILIAAECD